MIYIVDERLFFQAPPHMQVFIEEFLVNNVHFFLQKLASQLSRPRQKYLVLALLPPPLPTCKIFLKTFWCSCLTS